MLSYYILLLANYTALLLYRSRLKKRKYTLDTNIDWLDNRKEWKNIKAFVMCESVVISKGKERIERRYFITRLTDVKKVAKGIRSHWETRE